MTVPQGSPLLLTVNFTDISGIPFDPPTGIEIRVNDPNGGIQVYTYPATLTKNAVGSYSIQIPANIGGKWKGRGRGQLINGELVTTPDVVEVVTPSQVQ